MLKKNTGTRDILSRATVKADWRVQLTARHDSTQAQVKDHGTCTIPLGSPVTPFKAVPRVIMAARAEAPLYVQHYTQRLSTDAFLLYIQKFQLRESTQRSAGCQESGKAEDPYTVTEWENDRRKEKCPVSLDPIYPVWKSHGGNERDWDTWNKQKWDIFSFFGWYCDVSFLTEWIPFISLCISFISI